MENGRNKHSEKSSNDKVAFEQPNKSTEVDQDPRSNTTSEKKVEQYDQEENSVLINSSEKKKSKTATDDAVSGKAMNHGVVLYPLTEIKSTFSKLKKNGSLPQDDEGLSLFWIIILIILILWAIGVISAGFAIGSIINLLLLAALILLILWLLRIV